MELRKRLAVLAALLALDCALQAWMIARAVVPAQDAIRYVGMAQNYERMGLLAGLRSEAEHPLFPLLVWLTHQVFEHFSGSGNHWALCAQVTAAAMLVLSLIPVYLLLARLVDGPAAVAGAAFYCVITWVARLGADALSDSTQLFFVAWALYGLARCWNTAPVAMARGTMSAAWLWFVGLSIGLALMARTEAAVLLPATLATLIGLQCWSEYRQSWPRVALGIAALFVGLSTIQVPYWAATSSLSPDQMATRVLGRGQPSDERASTATSETWLAPDGQRLAFGLKDRSVSSRFHGHVSAVREYLRELPQAFNYWIGALTLCGLWQMRRLARRPWECFALVLFVMHSLAAIHLASSLGYLSPRHLVPLVPLTLAPAGWAAIRLGNWLSERVGVQRLGWCVAILAAALCLPRTLAPLHPTRAPHRQAGEWLANESVSPGTVLDTRGWTALYSGRPTLRYDAAQTAYCRSDLAFVVIEQRELELNSPRARTLVHLLGGAAEQAAVFTCPGGRPGENVLVYRWHPDRFPSALAHRL